MPATLPPWLSSVGMLELVHLEAKDEVFLQQLFARHCKGCNPRLSLEQALGDRADGLLLSAKGFVKVSEPPMHRALRSSFR